jgi:hypothetical protein
MRRARPLVDELAVIASLRCEGDMRPVRLLGWS